MADRIQWEQLRRMWNRVADESPPGNKIVRCASFTPNRQRAFRARLKEFGPDFFLLVCHRIMNSPFLQGISYSKGHSPLRLSVDWVLNSQNCAKIIEGKYDGGTSFREVKEEVKSLGQKFDEKEPVKTEDEIREDYDYMLERGLVSCTFKAFYRSYLEKRQSRRSQFISSNRRGFGRR